jgi:hypothetical protein
VLNSVQLLKDSGLFQQIFGFDIQQSTIDRSPFDEVKTMAEFIFLLTKLLPDPAEFYKTNLKGDLDTYKDIKALDYASKNVSDNKIKNRGIAFNMYAISPKSLESEILPNEIKIASQELLQGKYPKAFNDLVVNGNDLMTLGLKGKPIGDMQKSLLLKVYGDQVKNNREELLSLVPKKSNVNEFNYPELRHDEKPTWDLNGQKANINFFVEKYYIWNQGEFVSASRESVSRFLEDEFPQFAEDERLKKELLWELTDREILDEDMKNVRYSAVVLDSNAKFRLVERFKKYIPENFEIVAHHMTINMGKIDPEYEKYLGMSVQLTVEDIAIDDKVVAVGVSGFGTKNTKAHITLAVNTLGGGKPKDSNNLMNWQKLRRPLIITGKVTEVT